MKVFFSIQHLKLQDDLPRCLEWVRVRIYITGGRGFVRVNGVDFSLSAGCLCSFHSYHVFEFFSDDENPLEISTLAIDYALDSYLIIRGYTEKEENLFSFVPVVKLNERQRKSIEEIFTLFEEECNQNDSTSPIIKISLLGQLRSLETAFQRNCGSFSAPLGWKAMEFLTKFYSCGLTASMAAQHFSISVAELNRTLRRITTYRFDELCSRARIVAACALLPLKGLSLQHIANQIHFSSEKVFYNNFKKWMGMTPQEFREWYPGAVFGYTLENIYDLPHLVIAYVSKNYLLPINIKTAAKDLFISENKINQLLLKYTGVTFQEYVTQHRIRYAKGLLRTSEMPIGDIALESGFSAINTFCRIFKSTVGMTASEYRDGFRGDKKSEYDT